MALSPKYGHADPNTPASRAQVQKRVAHRVNLCDVELPTGSDERCDDRSPRFDVGQPVEAAIRSVDEVERSRLLGEVAGGLDRRPRETIPVTAAPARAHESVSSPK